MESRKLQLVGNRSYSVSLPKQWVLSNNLKEKDSVFIETGDNNELLIKSADTTRRQDNSITANMDDIDNICEFLMFCYVKNIDRIKLVTKRQNYEKIKSIKNILNYLEGYDITAEDAKKTEISFLFNDININIQKIMTRMTYSLRLLLTSLENKDHATLEETETSIDRLYHLSKRLLFSCIHSQKVRIENNIKHDEDVFFYQDIFKRIENVGDDLVRLKGQNLSRKEIETINKLIDLLYRLLIKKQNIQELKQKLMKISVRASDDKTKNIIEKMHERCIDIIENSISIEFNKQFF